MLHTPVPAVTVAAVLQLDGAATNPFSIAGFLSQGPYSNTELLLLHLSHCTAHFRVRCQVDPDAHPHAQYKVQHGHWPNKATFNPISPSPRRPKA